MRHSNHLIYFFDNFLSRSVLHWQRIEPHAVAICCRFLLGNDRTATTPQVSERAKVCRCHGLQVTVHLTRRERPECNGTPDSQQAELSRGPFGKQKNGRSFLAWLERLP
jgi:hypothetical protein